jgi:hypothetical protein
MPRSPGMPFAIRDLSSIGYIMTDPAVNIQIQALESVVLDAILR